MKRGLFCVISCAAALAAATAVARAAGSVTFSLQSPADGMYGTTGTNLPYSISASVSAGDNAGLAMFAVNLSQGASNPVKFDLPQAATPPAMSGFDAPAGFTNPGPGGSGTGYGGTPIGMAGQKDLVQIGGAQNTFGVPAGTLGQDVNVDSAIGQLPGGEVVASGTLAIPSTPGTYTFSISNAIANTLTTVNAAPTASVTGAATASIAQSTISFTVCMAGDANGDLTRDASDVPAFVDLQTGVAAGSPLTRCGADMNGDGKINGDDVQPFVNALLGP